ncbi:unnamed protein product [Arctogadus glacialis]
MNHTGAWHLFCVYEVGPCQYNACNTKWVSLGPVLLGAGLQKRLTALPPALGSMKTDYASLRSQVRNFSDFYGAAISDAKKQINAAIHEMSEANKDLMEKYRKEVVLRRKYHEQLVELKGNIRVLCRVKPVLKEDQQEEGQAVVVTTDPNNESALSVINKGKARAFELDKVFHPQATQEEAS